MRRALVTATILAAAGSTAAAGQNASVWIDANAAHSRPPSGAGADAASYGLVGARLRVDGIGSSAEIGATTGRGAADGAGGWLSGRALLSSMRARGLFDFGVRAEGSGLFYLSPVQLGGGEEYSQTLATGTVRPHIGASIAGVRLGAEALYTRGMWRSELSTPVLPGGPSLPGRPAGDIQQRTTSEQGDIVIAGGTASLLRMQGAATIELRATSYQVQNQAGDGRYTGLDGTVALALGRVDVTLGARRWRTPVADAELGGFAGLGMALGDAAYVQASVSRSVTDPLYGVAGDVGFSAGVSLRMGSRRVGPPAPAAIGAAAGEGRVVRFTLRHEGARSVAVAGDFSDWEPRALQRSGGEWTLETVLPPGIYHYSFVIDGDEWLVPEHASGLIDDGFGRKNATLVVNASEDR